VVANLNPHGPRRLAKDELLIGVRTTIREPNIRESLGFTALGVRVLQWRLLVFVFQANVQHDRRTLVQAPPPRDDVADPRTLRLPVVRPSLLSAVGDYGIAV